MGAHVPYLTSLAAVPHLAAARAGERMLRARAVGPAVLADALLVALVHALHEALRSKDYLALCQVPAGDHVPTPARAR